MQLGMDGNIEDIWKKVEGGCRWRISRPDEVLAFAWLARQKKRRGKIQKGKHTELR